MVSTGMVHLLFPDTMMFMKSQYSIALPDGVLKLHDLQEMVHPHDHSCNHGIDLYMTALQFVSSRL